MKNNNMLAFDASELDHIVPQPTTIAAKTKADFFEEDPESIRYWTAYRADVMEQLLQGNITVPDGMTADQVVDQHVAKIKNMCAMFSDDGLPVDRVILPSPGTVLNPAANISSYIKAGLNLTGKH